MELYLLCYFWQKLIKSSNQAFYYDTFEKQAGYQIVAVIVTLCIAIISGAFTGIIVCKLPFNSVKYPYFDGEFFELPNANEPEKTE